MFSVLILSSFFTYTRSFYRFYESPAVRTDETKTHFWIKILYREIKLTVLNNFSHIIKQKLSKLVQSEGHFEVLYLMNASAIEQLFFPNK